MEGMPAVTGTEMFSALCVRVCFQSDGYIAYAYGDFSKPGSWLSMQRKGTK